MEYPQFTFNDLLEMVIHIRDGVDQLSSKVDKLTFSNEADDEIQWLNVPELIKYLPTHPAEQTIYSWTSSRRIPFHKKGRRILFNKKEIDEWLQQGEYHKSELDLEHEAIQFVNNKRNNIIK